MLDGRDSVAAQAAQGAGASHCPARTTAVNQLRAVELSVMTVDCSRYLREAWAVPMCCSTDRIVSRWKSQRPADKDRYESSCPSRKTPTTTARCLPLFGAARSSGISVPGRLRNH